MPPFDQRLVDLLRTMRERLPRAPAWTEGTASDPGVTLAEVFAYLGDQLGTVTTRLPAEARAELARIGTRLLELDRPAATVSGTSDAATVDVRVDGERWTAVRDLTQASADATVFTLDRDSGAVRFGDGVHGRRPAAQATITVQYRHGAGVAGTVPPPVPWPPAPTAGEPADSWDGDN